MIIEEIIKEEIIIRFKGEILDVTVDTKKLPKVTVDVVKELTLDELEILSLDCSTLAAKIRDRFKYALRSRDAEEIPVDVTKKWGGNKLDIEIIQEDKNGEC